LKKKNKEDGSVSQYEYHISGVSELPVDHDFPLREYDENASDIIPVPMKYSNISTSRISINKPRRGEDNPIPKVSFEVANLLDGNPCQHGQGQHPIGVPIHSRCWDMVERSIGPCRTSNELERLVNILYKRWTSQSFFGLSNCVKVKNNRKIWDPVHQLKYRDPKPIFRPKLTFCHPEVLSPLTDPIDGRVIHRLLVDSIRECTKSKRHLLRRSWRFYRRPQRIRYQLPLEIMYMIFDLISGTKSWAALKMLENMGWQLPDSYWRDRIPRDIISELDEEISQLDPPADIDWPFLCLKAEMRCKTQYSLRNRHRILRIVRSVKSLVRKQLDDENEAARAMSVISRT
jgi:hypothetical protein